MKCDEPRLLQEDYDDHKLLTLVPLKHNSHWLNNARFDLNGQWNKIYKNLITVFEKNAILGIFWETTGT